MPGKKTKSKEYCLIQEKVGCKPFTIHDIAEEERLKFIGILRTLCFQGDVKIVKRIEARTKSGIAREINQYVLL